MHFGVMPWHFLFESFAYAAAFRIYLWKRTKTGDVIRDTQRSSVIVAAILGAAAGSKLLAWATDPQLGFRASGKTVVGAILGGTICVELLKRRLRIQTRTGDLFAIPLAAGIAIGRIGCFLGGLEDHTYGVATSLPWGVDFGDGIRRHPAQFYEVAAMLITIGALRHVERRPHRNGDVYRVFLVLYFAWRIAVDFLKPDPRMAGMSAIQWCALAGFVWYLKDAVRMVTQKTQVMNG